MQYVQQSLGPDEEIVHVGEFHWMYTLNAFMAIVWGVFLCIAVLAAAIIFERQTGWRLGALGYDPRYGWLDQIRALHPLVKMAAVMMFVMGLLRFAQIMIVKVTTEIAITTNRLIYKRGLIARYVGEISIDRIEGVNVLQSFWGRIFNYGRLVVRGMGVGEVILPPLRDPVVFRKAIDRARKL